jgi:hypothetical protein
LFTILNKIINKILVNNKNSMDIYTDLMSKEKKIQDIKKDTKDLIKKNESKDYIELDKPYN